MSWDKQEAIDKMGSQITKSSKLLMKKFIDGCLKEADKLNPLTPPKDEDLNTTSDNSQPE